MIKNISKLIRFCTVNKEQQVDYAKLVDQVMSASQGNDELRNAINKIIYEMRQVIENAYQSQNVEYVLQHVKSYHLCIAAVEQYVGSMCIYLISYSQDTPKNEQITQLFLSFSKRNATNEQEQLYADYFSNYIQKLEASSKGDKELFDQTNNQLIDLSQLDCYPAKHIVAKEMYKVAMNMMHGKQKKDKSKLLNEAYKLFYECAMNEFPHSFYYLGELAEKGDIPGGIDLRFALECYEIAAAYENPSAFFKLSRYYKDGVVCEKSPQLEFHYLRKSAEMGLLDAQHNLGVAYKEGVLCPKDEIKALAWFTQAGNFGFPLSMFNAGMMFWEGGNRIQQNRKAALVWFQKLQELGAIDVSKQIRQIVKEIENQE